MPPNIMISELSKAEQEIGQSLSINIHLLASSVATLESAVSLFDHCISLRIPRDDVARMNRRAWIDRETLISSWQLMAAKNGALAIYEFHRITQAIDTLVHRTSILPAMIDTQERAKSVKIFEEAFPKFGSVRLFVAHGNEMIATPEKMLKHRLLGHAKVDSQTIHNGIFVSTGSLHERTYLATSEGEIVSYKVDRDSVEKLGLALAARFASLEPAAIGTMDLMRERLQKNSAQLYEDRNSRQS